MDDSVSGNATFRFSDSGFENALLRFADYCNLFVTKKNTDYHISKISVLVSDNSLISLDTEEVTPELIIKKIAQEAKKTIIYDPLPQDKITVRMQNASIEDILKLLFVKNPEYMVITQNQGFYVKRDQTMLNEMRTTGSIRIDATDNLYTISGQRILFPALIDSLFKKANKEYLILNRTTTALENIFYENKDFDSLLRILLDSVNFDYKIENGVYYIFEIQRQDIVKKLKETVTLTLNHISALEIQNIIPSPLNAAGFIKIDKNTNSIFITGSREEIDPIIAFITSIDKPLDGRYYKLFTVKNISVKDALSLIPKSFLFLDPILVPNTPSFVTQVDTLNEQRITDYLNLIDTKNHSYPVKLKFIKSDELIKYLPPSALKENIAQTGDTSLVFFTGSEDSYNTLLKEIALIDQPKPQLRYQLLVIQRQRSDNLKWGSDITIKKTDALPSADFTAKIANLANINFDIVSSFGMQFAANLSTELGTDRAKILVDTTLNALSEEEITFQNTNTYRYRDVAIEADSGLYSGTTREITSGLILKIKGWVSGDGMITVSVDAKVSKQGAVSSSDTSTANPPPTSEKSVNTHVRSKSGEPIIIGGLLQSETDVTEKRIPFLGDIPLLGLLFRSDQIIVTDSELIIYLIPFVQQQPNSLIDMEKRMRSYYHTYILKESAY
jgi:type II secretory pathway component GspD/PulD (secretin)